MHRGVLLIPLLFVLSCKKEVPKGDLPPPTEPGSAAPAATAPPPAANPPSNPHAGMAPSNPADIKPETTPPTTLEKAADGKLVLGPFTVAPPADWKAKPVTSNMRAATFELPAKPGAEAELVVYYFGEGGAGGVQANLDRWIDQFKQPDGKSSRDVAKIEKTKFGGQEATFVSVAGKYTAMAMPGTPEVGEKADQALLAAIVDSPSGPYYFKLTGAKATVDSNAAAFRKMLDSLKLR